MTAPRVVGLDLSLTATGIATARSAGRIVGAAFDHEAATVTTGAGHPLTERLLDIRAAVVAFVHAHDPDVVAVEDFVGKSPAAWTLGTVHGVVRVALAELDVPVALIPPTVLKRYATGKGNASKSDIRVAALRRFFVDFGDDNEADAFVLVAMTLDAYGHPLTVMPAANRDTLERVEWPTLRTGVPA